MKLAIIGLPQSGKTTIFNALSGQQEAVGDYSRAVHRAVIKVPDERLDSLASVYPCKKVTHTTVEFLDAASFSGKGKKSTGELDGIHDLRLMDAVVIVIDAFSPASKSEHDLQLLTDEMILADLVMIENNADKLERSIRLTGKKDRVKELDVLKRCQETLNAEKMIAEMGLSEEEEKEIRGYAFLTLKPQLVIFNISEDKLPEYSQIYNSLKRFQKESIRDIAVICGKIEMDLALLDESERDDFLTLLNIDQAAIDRFIRCSYDLMGLISFFTLNSNECRAWAIRKGTTALKAAGVVHSDFERGFIRAEVASYEDYMQFKTNQALRTAARLHVEGKDYVVKDGDVIMFLFNV
jgi:GTP-binding protein YchF